ncbi:MAG: hypothetical protein AB199_02215 [Parcubacteria bacterium C7867-004]|nr:MAG: hypothetical protein AB199_02215 [Parcubacteria bacterium C7867-004]
MDKRAIDKMHLFSSVCSMTMGEDSGGDVVETGAGGGDNTTDASEAGLDSTKGGAASDVVEVAATEAAVEPEPAAEADPPAESVNGGDGDDAVTAEAQTPGGGGPE